MNAEIIFELGGHFFPFPTVIKDKAFFESENRERKITVTSRVTRLVWLYFGIGVIHFETIKVSNLAKAKKAKAK